MSLAPFSHGTQSPVYNINKSKSIFCLLFKYSETESYYIALAGLQLTMQTTLALKQSYLLLLPPEHYFKEYFFSPYFRHGIPLGNLRVFLFYFYRDVFIKELLIILSLSLDFEDFSFLPLCRLLCAMNSITPSETIRMNRADSSVNCSSGHQSGGELGTLMSKGRI